MNRADRINPASIQSRLKALHGRHAALDAAVQRARTRPGMDSTELSRLKRAKLKLKDEMAVLDGLHRTLGRGRRTALSH